MKSTETKDVYDLQFTLVGSYTRITDFLYDIENDEELNFEIKNFSISSAASTTQTNNTNNNNTEQTNTNNNNTEQTNQNNNNAQNNEGGQENKNTQPSADGYNLQAKFTVENVGITLD